MLPQVGKPDEVNLPSLRKQGGAVAHMQRRLENEECPDGVSRRPQGIDAGKARIAQALSPVPQFGRVTTPPAGLVATGVEGSPRSSHGHEFLLADRPYGIPFAGPEPRRLEPVVRIDNYDVAVCDRFPGRIRGRKGTATIRTEPILADPGKLARDASHRSRFGYVHATRCAVETVVRLPSSACRRLGEAIAAGLLRSMLTQGPGRLRRLDRE